MHRFEKTRLMNMKSRDVTSSRQKIPALKPPLIKGLKMFCARFFVTLEEFAGFLCIKAVPRIEKKIGLRTGDRSPFYVLLQIAFNEHPTLSHQPSYDSMSGAKVRKNPRIHKQLTIFVLRTSGHFCVPAPVSICDTHT